MRVSVVIASNRPAPFLDEAVASVRAQTHPVHEVILVDDGSPTDDLAAKAKRLGIRYIRQPAAGVSTAFNRGVAKAEGVLIAVLGDDDVWHPDRIRLQLEALTAEPRAIACFTGGWFLDGEGKAFGEVWHGATASRVDMLRGAVDVPVIGTMLIRRDALITAGGFHPAFTHGEDNELVLKLLNLGDFVGVDMPLFGYRRHDGNVSTDRLAGRTGSVRLLRLQIWGAQARGEPELERLLKENLRRYLRAAGRATAHEFLATARRGQWSVGWAAVRWGIRERRLDFLGDVAAVLGQWASRSWRGRNRSSGRGRS